MTLYTVTVKYELHHTRGESVPSIEEVQSAVEGWAPAGDELSVYVEREVDETQGQDEDGMPLPTGEKIKHFEGCRVVVDEVEIQEAKTR